MSENTVAQDGDFDRTSLLATAIRHEEADLVELPPPVPEFDVTVGREAGGRWEVAVFIDHGPKTPDEICALIRALTITATQRDVLNAPSDEDLHEVPC
jgi:hypothetical protein